MASRKIPQIAQGLVEHCEQHVDPLVGIRLRHLEHGAVGDLEGGHFDDVTAAEAAEEKGRIDKAQRAAS